jgi:hypothetical protein
VSFTSTHRRDDSEPATLWTWHGLVTAAATTGTVVCLGVGYMLGAA